MLQLLDLWSCFVQTLAVLSDRGWWVLSVKDHLVQLLQVVAVLRIVLFDVTATESLHKGLGEQSVIKVVVHQARQVLTVVQLGMVVFRPLLQGFDLRGYMG